MKILKFTISLISLLCFLFLGQNALSYPYYYFEKKNNLISSREFNRYIKPQIRSIVAEYYFILKKMDPFHGQSITFQNHFNQIYSNWEMESKKCFAAKDFLCEKAFKTLHSKLIKFDKKTFIFLTSKVDPKKSNLEAKLKLNEQLGIIQNYNYKALHLLEEYLLLKLNDESLYSKKKWEKIRNLLQKISIHSGNLLTLFLDEKMKKNFEFLRVNFIQNLERKVVIEKDSSYILSRLGDLNLAWNSFHMRVSKGNHKLNNNSKKTLKNMHSRWNSILKIILAKPN